MGRCWQHNDPLPCPKGHPMGWLGSVYWICEPCHVIYVQMTSAEEVRASILSVDIPAVDSPQRTSPQRTSLTRARPGTEAV